MPMGRFNALVLVLLLLLAAVLLPGGCDQGVEPSHVTPTTPIVRVLLLENCRQAQFSATESPLIRIGAGPVHTLHFPSTASVPVVLDTTGWTIGTLRLPRGVLTINPTTEGSVRVNNLPYRGHYQLMPVGNDQFDVVNEVDIEGYLKGVLARELFSSWHEETYRAQAIVSRTYALYESRMNGPGREFDLYCDQRSQVYGGLSAETAKSRDAVDATHGIVLAYGPPGQERIFKAYFSSCCGGITQSAADAFGDPATPPLSEQLIGPRCNASPHFNWGPVVIAKTELGRRVRAWAVEHNRPERTIGDVDRLDIQFQNRFGRPVRFVLTDTHGVRFSMSGEDFRQAFNTQPGAGPTIFSSFFKPVNEPTDIRLIDGHGFGHGVGFCQWCAEAEAWQGIRHEIIATSAYPGSRLVRPY
jgi:stage II sporulation protein D